MKTTSVGALLLTAFALLPMRRAEAALGSRVEAHYFVTNVANLVTSNSFTVNGDTRFFQTNVTVASKQIAITNTIGFQKTNVVVHALNFVFTNGVDTFYGAATNEFVFLAQPNKALTASLVGTWGYITLKTNVVYDGETRAAGTNGLGRQTMTNNASATVSELPAATNAIPTGIKAMENYADLTTAQALSNKRINGGTISNTVVGRLDLISTPGSALGDGYLNFMFAAPQSGLDPESKGSGLRFYDGNTNAFVMISWNGEDPYPVMRWGTNTGGGPFDAIVLGPAVDVSALIDLTTEHAAGLLLNAKSATRIFPIMDGAAISFGASGWTNDWKSFNRFGTSTNEFNTLTKFNAGVYVLGGFGSNIFLLRPSISNAVTITVTNLQAFGGMFSNFFGTANTFSNTASFNNRFGGTNTLTGLVGFGPAYEISGIAAGNNYLDVGTNTHVRLTGTPGTNWTMTGIKEGTRTAVDGDIVLIEGRTGWSATIANESAALTTGDVVNRIQTLNGGDPTSSGDFLALALYNGTSSRWEWNWWNRGSGTANGTQATNAIAMQDGFGTNTTFAAQDTNHIGVTFPSVAGQQYNTNFAKIPTNGVDVSSGALVLGIDANGVLKPVAQAAAGSGSGETNFLGNAGATNASNLHLSIMGSKVGVTNQVLTVGSGANINATNEAGTNITFALKPDISISSLVAAGITNSGVLKQQGAVSNETWQVTAGINTNLNRTYMKALAPNSAVITDQSGMLTTLAGRTNTSIYNFNNGFSRLRSIIQTNGTLIAPWFGDSLVTGQLGYPMANHFVNAYGFAGFEGQEGASYGSVVWATTNTPGVALITQDFTSWFCNYRNITNGNSCAWFATNTSAGGFVPITANIITFNYIEENGGPTFNILTNGVAIRTAINANNGGAKHGVSLRITNSFSASYTNIIAVVTSGNPLKALGPGLINYPARGVVLNTFAQGGLGIDQFTQVPTNITGPILFSWDPDFILMKWLDNSWTMAASFPSFNAFVSNYLAKTDILYTPPNPIIAGTADAISDVATQTFLWFSNALATGQSFKDVNVIFGSTNNAVARGLLAAAFDPHPTPAGDQFQADDIMAWGQFFSADGENYGTRWHMYQDDATATLTNSRIQFYAHHIGGGPDKKLLSLAGNTIASEQQINVAAPTLAVGFDLTTFAPPTSTRIAAILGDIACYQGGNFLGVNGAGLYVSGDISSKDGWLNSVKSTNFSWSLGPNTNEARVAIKAGGGTSYARTGGLLFTNQISTGNGAGTVTVLFTNSVPQNTITNLGDALLVRSSGQYGASANADKTIVLWLGSSIVYSNRQSINGGAWVLDAEIVRGTTITNYDCNIMLTTSTSGTTSGWYTNMSAFSTNSLNGIGLWMTGNGTGANDIVGKTWRARWEPSF